MTEVIVAVEVLPGSTEDAEALVAKLNTELAPYGCAVGPSTYPTIWNSYIVKYETGEEARAFVRAMIENAGVADQLRVLEP